MTLSECLWQCTGMCNDASVTCITMMNGGFATNIMSALYDHAKQYDDEHTSHETERWKLHGNISRNGYGNAMIGR